MRGVDFAFAVGDEVAYEGKMYKLVEVHGPKGEPVSAVIEGGSGATRKVPYAALRRAGSAIPVKRLPAKEAEVGKFVAWLDEEEVTGGTVISVAGGHKQMFPVVALAV